MADIVDYIESVQCRADQIETSANSLKSGDDFDGAVWAYRGVVVLQLPSDTFKEIGLPEMVWVPLWVSREVADMYRSMGGPRPQQRGMYLHDLGVLYCSLDTSRRKMQSAIRKRMKEAYLW